MSRDIRKDFRAPSRVAVSSRDVDRDPQKRPTKETYKRDV